MNGTLKQIQWNSSGFSIQGSVHTTSQTGSPWVIVSHGFSGHRIGPGYLFVGLSRKLLEVGISSLRYDFRGCGESEGSFCDISVGWMREDLFSAVKFVREKFDPGPIILLGHSFGGLISALCADTLAPDALILLSPPSDTDALLARHKNIYENGPNKNGFYQLGPHQLKLSFIDGIRKLDPVSSLINYRGRLLIIHGDCDETVPAAESERYFLHATEAGLNAQYHLLRGADHNFSSAVTLSELFTVIKKWIKEWGCEK